MIKEKFKDEIIDYGKSNGSIPTEFEIQVCKCGNKLFQMYSDDTEGGCSIVCSKCSESISIEDSADYMEDTAQNTCICESEELEVMVGKSFYADSNDTKFVYVGGMCPKCELAGVYVDWIER